VQYRDIIHSKMKEYSWAEKYDRNDMKVIIVTTIRSMDPPSRFLKRDTATDKWFDIGDKKAIVKVGQAFRHLKSIYDDKSFVSKEDNNNNNNNDDDGDSTISSEKLPYDGQQQPLCDESGILIDDNFYLSYENDSEEEEQGVGNAVGDFLDGVGVIVAV